VKEFSEELFLYALTTRLEDARRFSSIFRPSWLQTTQYRPILEEIYAFTKKEGIPPSVRTLRTKFKKADPALYEARQKKALDAIEVLDPDVSEIVYHLDQAKQVAVSWSLKELFQDEAFQAMNDSFDGPGQIQLIEEWLRHFARTGEDVEVSIREAIKRLKESRQFLRTNNRIECGIKVIDNFTGGGLRPPGLGIIMAPTGEGKSNALVIMSNKMAVVERKRVLLITNELSTQELTERLLSSITAVSLDDIIDDPIRGIKGLERHWKLGLDKRLRIIEVMREINVYDIEAMVAKYINVYGWSPEVVVIDFMERMKPIAAGEVKRDQSWNWYGAIAKDLVFAAKKQGWLIWTACQTNRGGTTAKVLDTSHAQGSIQHFQEAKAVIAMNEVKGIDTGDPEVKLLEFRSLKMREGRRLPDPVIVEARFGKMEISDRVREMQEFSVDAPQEVADKGNKPPKKGVKTPREQQKIDQRVAAGKKNQ
jgi:hypothetical protein